MDISKSVALLKACLDHVPRIKSLYHNPKNQEVVQWDGEVKRIIIDTFGRDSKEYTRYNSTSCDGHKRTEFRLFLIPYVILAIRHFGRSDHGRCHIGEEYMRIGRRSRET